MKQIDLDAPPVDRRHTGRPASGLVAAVSPPGSNQQPGEDFDRQDLLERVMGNEDLACRVAAKFIEDVPEQLAALTQALSRGDAQTTRRIAHGVKGSAANVGVVLFSEIASRLERSGDDGDLESAAIILADLSRSFEQLKPRLQEFCGR